MASAGPNNAGHVSSSQGGANNDNRIRVELAVNFRGQEELDKIDRALKSQGVNLVASDLQAKTIQVELGNDSHDHDHDDNAKTSSSPPSLQGSLSKSSRGLDNVQSLQRFIEKQTGLVAVIKGLGSLSAAVSELGPPPAAAAAESGARLMGVVRIAQLPQGRCFFDGLIDWFLELEKTTTTPSNSGQRHYKLAVHEFGDLSSDSFDSIGQPVVHVHNQLARGDHSLSVRRIVPNCDVVSMIGKSIALTEHTGTTNKVLSAGVIARASTVQANEKRICSCSGKTLWQERLDKQKEESSKI